MLKKLEYFFPELLIFSFAFLTRFIRLNFPPTHMFDEVYHAFTAQEMFKGNPAVWEWWNTSPPGFAFEWTHPPLAKEFMVFSIFVFGDNAFAWRFFSAFFGTGIIILIYFITLTLFKNRKIALLSSLVASLDGLLLVMSRIAMNDTYFLFFSLLAIFLFLKNKNLLMGIALGLAIASKWTGFFTIGIIGYLYVFKSIKIKRWNLLIYLIIPPVIYLLIKKKIIFLLQLLAIPVIIYFAAYLPFFLQHHSPPGQNSSNLQTFIGLQQQMWWYHTNLKATHAYQSTPTDWLFDLRPVWIYVDYRGDSVASIYTLGNPSFMWGGFIAIIFLMFEFIKKRTLNLGIILLSYFGFFLPWIFSPRIMFNYHYLPSSVFLAIAIGFTLNKLMKLKNGKFFVIAYCLSLVALFIYFYPLWTGVYIDKKLYDSYFWLKSWR